VPVGWGSGVTNYLAGRIAESAKEFYIIVDTLSDLIEYFPRTGSFSDSRSFWFHRKGLADRRSSVGGEIAFALPLKSSHQTS
jgi:hypothetical protein